MGLFNQFVDRKKKYPDFGRQNSPTATKEVYRTCAKLPYQEIQTNEKNVSNEE